MEILKWHRIRIAQDECLRWKHADIQDEFERRFVARLGPRSSGLLAGERDSSDAFYLYLSPGSLGDCMPLIVQHCGEQCEEPPRGSVTLLVGHQDVWEDYLPGDPGSFAY